MDTIKGSFILPESSGVVELNLASLLDEVAILLQKVDPLLGVARDTVPLVLEEREKQKDYKRHPKVLEGEKRGV